MSRKYIVVICATLIIVVGGAYFFSELLFENDNSDLTTELETLPTLQEELVGEVEREPITERPSSETYNVPFSVIHSEYAFNVGDTRALTSWADNVFVAKVVAKVGEEPRTRSPQTQYSASIVTSLKGTLSGSIIINQAGVGYAEGKLFVREGDLVRPTDDTVNPDDVFLKPGGLYIFAAGYDDKKNWYTISAPPYDRKLIAVEEELSVADAINLSKQNPRVQEFITAARELGVLNEEWK